MPLIGGSLRSREGQVEVGVVHPLQAPDEPLHARRQGLECEMHVCEQGVAARRGHLDGVERRAEWWPLSKGHVDVPAAAEGFDLVGQLDDFDELRIPVHAVRVRVRFERAEAARECQVLLRGQVLIAEEEHEVLAKRPVDAASRSLRREGGRDPRRAPRRRSPRSRVECGGSVTGIRAGSVDRFEWRCQGRMVCRGGLAIRGPPTPASAIARSSASEAPLTPMAPTSSPPRRSGQRTLRCEQAAATHRARSPEPVVVGQPRNLAATHAAELGDGVRLAVGDVEVDGRGAVLPCESGELPCGVDHGDGDGGAEFGALCERGFYRSASPLPR